MRSTQVIEMSGYLIDEKLQIARKHLLPRQIMSNGLPPEALHVPDATLAGGDGHAATITKLRLWCNGIEARW